MAQKFKSATRLSGDQPQHILDAVKSRLLMGEPLACLYRAARKDEAVIGPVADFQLFERPQKQRGMLANRAATPHGREPDCADRPCAILPGTAKQRMGVKIQPARAGCRLTDSQRRAGRGISLAAMVGFDNFQIKLF